MARQPKPWYRTDRSAWFVTIAGVRHNLGDDKKKAFGQFYTLMQQPAENPSVSRSFFAGIADAFLDWVQNNRSPDTYEWYRYRLERFCQRYPDLNCNQLKPFHVQQWAESRDLVINPEDFKVLLTKIPDECMRQLCLVAFETGCRPQEILNVEARHLEPEHERWVFPVKEAKGKKAPRIVYLSKDALRISQELAAKNPTGKLFRNSDGKAWTTSAVNCSFCRLQYRIGKQTMLEKAGILEELIGEELLLDKELRESDRTKLTLGQRRKLTNRVYARFSPKYSLYALRHSWATNALRSGMDALTVAILMGHSDPSTLSKVYQHLAHSPEHMLRQARKAVGQ